MSERTKGIEAFVGPAPFGKKMPLGLESVMPCGTCKGMRVGDLIRKFGGSELLGMDLEFLPEVAAEIRKRREDRERNDHAFGYQRPPTRGYSAEQMGWIEE